MRRHESITFPGGAAAAWPARQELPSIGDKLVTALLIAAALGAMAMCSTVAALETPKPKAAQIFLGTAVTGSNYKVKPVARSDGIMRIFEVETPYGEFQFDGVEFTKMRLHELDAITALEKMSQSEVFATALGHAAVAPVQFGADLSSASYFSGNISTQITGPHL
jgi:hypothetical protein